MRAVVALAFLVLLGGCERGCLKKKIDRNREDKRTGIAAPLAAVDCPDGLARCVDGTVEVSRLYSYDVPCTANPERCRCPWERVAVCASGCAAGEAVLPLTKERAETQLCAGTPGNGPIATPPPPNDAIDPAVCEGERYRCDHNAVVACEPSAHRVGLCVLGCAVADATLDEASVTDRGAIDVLCLHLR